VVPVQVTLRNQVRLSFLKEGKAQIFAVGGADHQAREF
jgi:hypothetical protein